MSSIFRTIGSTTKRHYQALAIAGVLLLAALNYTGFTLPRSHMHPWFKWIIWINPLAYAFEILIVNEVNEVEYACAR
jgi:ATP-binding cassette subfamily G (WHITE) protein 2 (PDR)